MKILWGSIWIFRKRFHQLTFGSNKSQKLSKLSSSGFGGISSSVSRITLETIAQKTILLLVLIIFMGECKGLLSIKNKHLLFAAAVRSYFKVSAEKNIYKFYKYIVVIIKANERERKIL
jgi:hypothetical protein